MTDKIPKCLIIFNLFYKWKGKTPSFLHAQMIKVMESWVWENFNIIFTNSNKNP